MADNGGPLPQDTGPPLFDQDDLADYIPHLHEPSCCCGNVACTFLRETQAAFDRLDESLRTAGRLGQVRESDSLHLLFLLPPARLPTVAPHFDITSRSPFVILHIDMACCCHFHYTVFTFL